MKRFLKKLVGIVPIALIIAVTNLIVDPANIYKKGYEAQAAQVLLHGENIVGMTNYDERIFQKEIIKGETNCPDTIILGSSRVMTLSEKVIADMGNYKNHGVSGAGIYDYMGILGVYESCGKLPQKIIFGLDPWILNEKNGDTRYQSLAEYVNSFEAILEGREKLDLRKFFSSLEKKMQLLSIPYYQSSVEILFKEPEKVLEDRNKIDFSGTLETVSEDGIRYTDGSIDYGQEQREADVESVNEAARIYVAGNIYQMEDYDSLNESYCILLERLIDYLQKKGVEIIIYLPPYHPYVYQYLEKTPKYCSLLEAETYFLDLAEKRKMKVYGSYNPQILDCREEDFFDGMHMKRESVGKSWKSLSVMENR